MIKNYKLYHYYNFTPQDLEANKEGKLTPNQQEVIDQIAKESQASTKGLIKIFFIIFLSVPLIAFFFNTFNELKQLYFLPIIFLLVILILIVRYFIKPLYQEAWKKIYSKSITASCKVAKGNIKKYRSSYHNSPNYFEVNGAQFYVNDELLESLEPEQLYSFYYVSLGKYYNMILSWETLS